ncbi:MAG TPA: tRNA (N6-isopentenyl adenosine(37)-C2)-methylthiotransferase MiaB [Nitrospiria bacterium]|nr:tRNA (N6-isopentenyl adenosine(37)-C2)-methylthiotransferase MiaB [Candidatus Manganitrophaceae bacterium]HIL33992.1 tRNA (N6-isopentenyl adenosine(37)-C2)-methylthiotransferase MiaB [Candidatus Manganitrophaceae bacterium]
MKVYLETYGCQMNEYDSELVRSILTTAGNELTPRLDEAEAVLINTCAIRENAHRKIYGRLDLLRPLKKRLRGQGRDLVVGLLGCMAQNLKQELFKHPVLNLIVGPDNYRALPKLITRVKKQGSKEIDANLSEYETYRGIAPARVEGVNAWIAIMRGCDNFCSFCVVPYTRGRERSREIDDVLEEVKALAAQGYRQVTLLGQNVNSYRSKGGAFSDLILKVADVPGIQRVRFTSPHPKDFPQALLEAISSHPNICKHIHLPLQAGSDRILEMMNRTYQMKEYMTLVNMIRKMIPGVVLTTDIIVGFPSETEKESRETAEVMEAVGFDSAYIFKYSERKGTIASREFSDNVSADEKKDRIIRLFDIQRRISLEKNQKRIGQNIEVLIEGSADKRPDHQMGKSDGNQTVIFPNTSLHRGSLVMVEIMEASAGTLYGNPLHTPALTCI